MTIAAPGALGPTIFIIMTPTISMIKKCGHWYCFRWCIASVGWFPQQRCIISDLKQTYNTHQDYSTCIPIKLHSDPLILLQVRNFLLEDPLSKDICMKSIISKVLKFAIQALWMCQEWWKLPHYHCAWTCHVMMFWGNLFQLHLECFCCISIINLIQLTATSVTLICVNNTVSNCSFMLSGWYDDHKDIAHCNCKTRTYLAKLSFQNIKKHI